MKRILSIIVALVALAGVAEAQITIKKTADKPRQLTTLSMSWSWIYQMDDSYYIVLKSDNRFDDMFWLKIGSSKGECLESVSALKDMIDNMEDSDRYEIENGEGETFYVSLMRELGIKKLAFQSDHNAGSGFLLASNISKALKWIEQNVKE